MSSAAFWLARSWLETSSIAAFSWEILDVSDSRVTCEGGRRGGRAGSPESRSASKQGPNAGQDASPARHLEIPVVLVVNSLTKTEEDAMVDLVGAMTDNVGIPR